MRCSDFLSRFSDFRDGGLPSADAAAVGEHLRSCESCRRYASVLDRGIELLRESPPAELPADFRARLQHSIYSFEEERRRRRLATGGTGFGVLATVAAALAVIVWSPVLEEVDPVVELPAIVAHNPALPPTAVEIPQLSEARRNSLVALPLAGQELWEESNALLYQHSPVYLRHREASLVRAGLR